MKAKRNRKEKRGPLRDLYRGVKLPVFRTLLGSLLNVVGTLVIGSQAESIGRVAAGDFTDLSPIFTYALMGMIGYVFILLSTVADLGFAELAAKIRKKIWNKTMRLPLSYYDKESPNRVISRITSDPEYSYYPFKLLQLSLMLLAMLLVVLTGNAAVPQLALLLMLGFVLTMAVMFFTSKFSDRGTMLTAEKLSAHTAFLAERFNKIPFIRAMNSGDREIRNGDRYIEERYQAEEYNAMASTWTAFGQAFLPMMLYTAAFLAGGLMIAGGKLRSTAELTAFYAYGNNLVLVFQFFAQFPSVFAVTKGGSRKITEIFGEAEELLDEGKETFGADGDIVLENVSFRYGENRAVENVSAVIPKGKVTAVIGPNGSGKTTLLRLVDRLYPDFGGDIRIGGESGSGVSLRAWRDRFGIVSQNAALFEGSIRDNICYGVKDVKEEELQQVVRLSCLEDVIASHEGGLEFNVGANGGKLSGGERQRVAIARAMLRNPDYLILDEATANLDPVTEKKVRDSVLALTRGRTAIVVAHSPNAVAGADKVIVMENGTVTDQGTPAELMERSGYFRAFAAS